MDLLVWLKSFLKRNTKILGISLAVVISILIFVFRNKIVLLQEYGLFGLFVISIIGNATVILPAPVILSAYIGGAIYNPFLVTLVISLGAAIGELTGYLAGVSGREIIDEPKFKKVKTWMEKYETLTLFILAAIPNPLFDLAGIIAGATKIPIYKYLIIVFFGKCVKFGSVAILGANTFHLINKFHF